MRSLELGRRLALWPWHDRSQSQSATTLSELHRMRLQEHLESAGGRKHPQQEFLQVDTTNTARLNGNQSAAGSAR